MHDAREEPWVSMSGTSKPDGLRARKRRATENAIELSAVRLALKHGVENVTVEAICEMADISRSTFFNYFPARDYAIVGRSITLPDGTEAFSVLDSCPDNLPLGIFRLAFASIGHRHVNAEVARLRAQVITEQPEALGLLISAQLESSFQLTAMAAAWLQANPEHARLESPQREAVYAVTLVNGMMASHMEEWAKADGDTLAQEEEFLDALDEYRRLLSVPEGDSGA